MIQGAAKLLAAQFFNALDAQVQTEGGESPARMGLLRASLKRIAG